MLCWPRGLSFKGEILPPGDATRIPLTRQGFSLSSYPESANLGERQSQLHPSFSHRGQGLVCPEIGVGVGVGGREGQPPQGQLPRMGTGKATG